MVAKAPADEEVSEGVSEEAPEWAAVGAPGKRLSPGKLFASPDDYQSL